MAQDNKTDEWPEAKWGKNAKHNYGMATESPKLVSGNFLIFRSTQLSRCSDDLFVLVPAGS